MCKRHYARLVSSGELTNSAMSCGTSCRTFCGALWCPAAFRLQMSHRLEEVIRPTARFCFCRWTKCCIWTGRAGGRRSGIPPPEGIVRCCSIQQRRVMWKTSGAECTEKLMRSHLSSVSQSHAQPTEVTYSPKVYRSGTVSASSSRPANLRRIICMTDEMLFGQLN